MRLYVLWLCLAIYTMGSVAQDAIPGTLTFGTTTDTEFEQKFYRLYTGFCSFEDAAKTVASHGGTLFAPLSKDENDFITKQFGNYVGNFFIGITRNDAGQWITPDGKAVVFQNWSAMDNVLPKEQIRAMIKFDNGNGIWVATMPDAKASGFIAKFDQKPKPQPTLLTNNYGMELDEEKPTELNQEEKTTTPIAPNELPGALSANILYTKYLYPNGVFNLKLQDKTPTISGLAQPSTIRKIDAGDKLWGAYQGKYLMPILGDNVICFFDESPDIGNAPWSIVKVKGVVKRGPQFKQLVVENAYLTGSRKVRTSRRVIVSKNDSYVQIFGRLNNQGNIINDNIIEIQTGTENEYRRCHIGDDPEGFALELYALKLNGETTNLAVGIIGVLLDPEDKEGPLTRCRIAGWLDPSKIKRGPEKPPTGEKGNKPPVPPK